MAEKRFVASWAWLAGGAFAVVVAAIATQWFLQPGPPSVEPAVPVNATAPAAPAVPATLPAEPAAETPVEPAAEAPVEPAATAVVEPVAPAAAPLPEPPTFDTVRVEPGGSTLVAGKAPAGSTIRVLVDGAEVATGPVSDAGGFALLFDLPPSEAARLMTLEAVLPDGRRLVSLASVAIAPTTAIETAAANEVAPAVGVSATDPIPRAEPPATLLLTEEGAEVLRSPIVDPTEDAIVDTVTIDSIAYTPEGAVQLSGQAPAGGVLRIYLDNAELLTVPRTDTGPWSATLPVVAPGLYTLRVDQIGADGSVASRFETPFKRETAAALAAATITVPTVDGPADAIAAAPTEPVEPSSQQPADDAVSSAAQPSAPVVPAPTDPATIRPPVGPVAPQSTVIATDDPVPSPTIAPVSGAGAQDAPPAVQPQVSVTVQPGFTLWRIARENFGDGILYVQVFEANREKIKDPDLIYPGQIFTLPQIEAPAP